MQVPILLLLLAQQVPTPPALPPQVEGLWSGVATCPPAQGFIGQQLPLEITIGRSGSRLEGVLMANDPPRQFFFVQAQTVSLTGTRLHIEVDAPNNSRLALDGTVDSSGWNATLNQGPLTCPAHFTRQDADFRHLPIAPSYQTQPMWCWLTVGEMLFRHLNILTPNDPAGNPSQCMILESILRDQTGGICGHRCNACGGLGGGNSRQLAGMLSDFPRKMKQSGRLVPRVFSAVTERLNDSDLIAEIDRGNPVIIGISPSRRQGILPWLPLAGPIIPDGHLPPMHVALVVAYQRVGPAARFLVNDPYPFPLTPQNPYLAAGAAPYLRQHGPMTVAVAYWIDSKALHQRLDWSESFIVRTQ